MKSMALAGGTGSLPVADDSPAPESDVGAITLDAKGMIQECDETLERKFGYSHGQARGQHLSTLFPELADIELLQHGHLNERLHFFCHIGKRFQALRRDGARFASRLFMTMLGSDDAPRFRVIVLCLA